MKPVEIALDNLAGTLDAARQITFILAGFSIAAIYLIVLSGGALRQELVQLEATAQNLQDTITKGNQALGTLRTFYEGPVESGNSNFASFIYALDVAEFELGLALGHVKLEMLSADDRAFLAYQADLVRSNVFELRSIVGGLIAQKKNRVPFAGLPIADLNDLDYHKGKDAWGLYADFTSLRYALQNKDSYGFQESTAGIVGLEARFNHYRKEAEKNRSASTIPAKAGHTPEVTMFLAGLSDQGYGSLAEVSAKLANVRVQIEEKQKQNENSLKLPFLEQPIDATTLGWVFPLTTAIGTLFCIFYVNRARELHKFASKIDAAATAAKIMYPWIFLTQPQRDALSQVIGIVLQVALVGSPIVASSLLLWLLQDASIATLAIAYGANALLLGAVVLMARCLLAFRQDLKTVT